MSLLSALEFDHKLLNPQRQSLELVCLVLEQPRRRFVFSQREFSVLWRGAEPDSPRLTDATANARFHRTPT